MKKFKIAINGFGRIGRGILKSYYENNKKYKNFKIVAINDLGNIENIVHLIKYDTVHGKFFKNLNFIKNKIIIDKDIIKLFNFKDPNLLPWKKLKIDIVYECTGLALNKEKAYIHINNGAKKVIVSSPCDRADKTIVIGVNENILNKNDNIISNSSCTTNCLANIIKPLLDNNIKIINGFITTIHSYTNDQNLIDNYHYDFRRSRSATQSIIPTKTGATKTIEILFPDLKNKLSGNSIRVPTINVSLLEFYFNTFNNIKKFDINLIFKKLSNKKIFENIIYYNNEQLVSIDFNHSKYSLIFDSTLTKVNDNFIKISAWYDNEWGFCNRMLDLTNKIISIC